MRHVRYNKEKMDAATEYAKTVKKLRANLALMEKVLKGHEICQRTDNQNWGYVGDVNHWNDVVTDILKVTAPEEVVL